MKVPFFLFVFINCVFNLTAQPFIALSPNSQNSEPNSFHRSADNNLNQILDQYNVIEYKFAFPYNEDNQILSETCVLVCNPHDPKIVDDLLGTGLFHWAEEVKIYTNESSTCSDPYLPSDSLSQIGAGNRWVVDELELDCAWSINSGCGTAKIAFVDSGFEATHPEITNQICDSVFFYNPSDKHGLRTSSLAVAEENNFGITGVNPKGKIYAINSLFNIGFVFNFDDVSVVNLSWINSLGPPPPCSTQDSSMWYGQTLPEAINEMLKKGITPILSSGDFIHSQNGWCTLRDIPGLIYVSGVKPNPYTGIVDWSSSTARNIYVDILAPASGHFRAEAGGTIGQYTGLNGNSSATAFMSGVVSLMLCENPCLLPGDIENILEFSGNPVPSMTQFPNELGAGLISAKKALTLAPIQNAFPDVTGNTTIDAPINVYNSIRVKSSGTLTINSLVHFNDENYGIIVEKGGKLILKDAHLKNGCNNATWAGIQVMGNPNASQYIPNSTGIVDQGYLKVTNSIIENANTAIKLADEFFNNLAGGGICEANGLTVRNCLRGITMDRYPGKISSLPHGLLPNRTFIRNCIFSTDDDYPFVEGYQFHVLADDISVNTNIINSRFSDDRTDYSQEIESFGLRSNSSKLSVSGGTEFNNLTYGIKASTIYGINNLFVKETTFDSCFIGASLRNVPFVIIDDNDFYIGGYQGTTAAFDFPDQPTGLILDHSTGFRVEGNEFDGGQATGLNPIGILARNTSFGSTLIDFNQIKENTFSELRSGNLANENNGGDGNLGGLVYKCNLNEGDNEEDITVAFGSVAINQTDIPTEEVGVDNTLSNSDNGNPFSDIDNASQGGFIRYYYSVGPNLEPLYYPTTSVFTVTGDRGCIEDDPCPKCVVLSDSKRNELITFIQNEDPTFQAANSTYKGKLDAGNTAGIISDLQSAQNWSTGIIDAITHSPYVSTEVADVLVQSTIIPVQERMNVFYRNPELVQINEVWEWINDNVAMSTYTLNQIEQVRLQLSARGQEELEIEALGRPLIQAGTALIKHYLYQDENIAADLNAASVYIAKYFSSEVLLSSYLQGENWTATDALINDELVNNSNTDLWNFFQILKNDLQNEDYSLSSSLLVSQANLMINSNDATSRQIGRNLLSNGAQFLDFQNEGILSESQQLKIRPNVIADLGISQVLIFPNPASDELVNIHIRSDDQFEGEVRIINALGQEISNTFVQESVFSLVIKNFAPGLYFVVLESNFGETIVEQLIIQ